MATHKVLVIDDSKVIRMKVRDMLPQGNFEILEAADGTSGLNLIQQERPSLIMLDFLLPRMSGYEVFRRLQEHPELQNIPLVLMSGRREEVTEKIQEPFEYFEFIEKPFEQRELVGAIKEAMIKAKKRPQAAPVATASNGSANGAGGDVVALNAKVDELQKQVKQLLMFVSQLNKKVQAMEKRGQ
ncbi:PleD family two-component system response regulator [Leptolyngbya sp. FACHB-261]|uniref:response regulator n=1 Tax=Leptolyngbya sp. FACHB-261 TaxID=2692806 RepID=UPI0016875904|nr:response regulator [Leptolyngbya sp. FACHB-261]MBD2104169.1 response regulator [Leptolyngbya sp. FACHB-261]